MKKNGKFQAKKADEKSAKVSNRSYCFHVRSGSQATAKRQTVTSKDPVFPGEKKKGFESQEEK